MSEFNLIGVKTVDDLRTLLQGTHMQDPTGVLSWLEAHATAIEFSTMPAFSAVGCAIKLKPQHGHLLCEAKSIPPGATAVETVPALLTHAIHRFVCSQVPPSAALQYVH